ncbi:hypothetical protein [Oceanirhabdus seepicola]|uniref:Uncharacterized protein n=1 Tax=Oceanirhabdus seepicola TaxID=2828781 RepID=A0A9J6NWR1_9CLOT|nr:hypothetical protein [Oceanirhabdus seepicola]MCM1988492.1 hypothetical protein [Oceanirhabdus seepicola]
MLGLIIIFIIVVGCLAQDINKNTRAINKNVMLKILDDDENLKNLYAIDVMGIAHGNMDKITRRYQRAIVSKNYDKYKATADKLFIENIITKKEYERMCKSLRYKLPIENKK